jgi:hypothetical protein
MERKGRVTRMTRQRMTKRRRARVGKPRTKEDRGAWAGGRAGTGEDGDGARSRSPGMM